MAWCNKESPTNPSQHCLSAKGHRGRHSYRPYPGTGLVKESPVEMKESMMGPGGIEIAVVETGGEPVTEEMVKEDVRPDWTPSGDDFISLKGKAYLPARRRIQWMRGLPVPHPDWTIDTEIVEHVAGTLVKPGPVGVGKIDKGFAVVRANIYDTDGRLISTGLKSEYSENFADYLEKAETGAIARALAVAGYGTESAIDLDEGVDAGRIADAPVETASRTVRLGPSTVSGVGRGGKTDGASVAQIRRVASLSRELELSPEGLTAIIGEVCGSSPKLGSDEAHNSAAIATFLSERSGTEVGAIIGTLEAALASDGALEVAART